MQKILLIGILNDTLNNIYKALRNDYQVQICKMEPGEVSSMLKIVEPDMLVINIDETMSLDREILENLRQRKIHSPVIFVGSFENCREYLKDYNDSLFGFVEIPIMQSELLRKCKEMFVLARSKAATSGDKDDLVKKRILIVDDSGVFLRAVKALLEPKYETIVAKSGEKALILACTDNPDLILLDYEMPGLDGRETLEKLRENSKTADIPVVFLTGVSDRAHILEVLKMQPQGYLLKPIDVEELEKKITEIFG